MAALPLRRRSPTSNRDGCRAAWTRRAPSSSAADREPDPLVRPPRCRADTQPSATARSSATRPSARSPRGAPPAPPASRSRRRAGWGSSSSAASTTRATSSGAPPSSPTTTVRYGPVTRTDTASSLGAGSGSPSPTLTARPPATCHSCEAAGGATDTVRPSRRSSATAGARWTCQVIRSGCGGGARISAVQPAGARSATARRIADRIALASSLGSPDGGGAAGRRRRRSRRARRACFRRAAARRSATNSPGGPDGPSASLAPAPQDERQRDHGHEHGQPDTSDHHWTSFGLTGRRTSLWLLGQRADDRPGLARMVAYALDHPARAPDRVARRPARTERPRFESDMSAVRSAQASALAGAPSRTPALGRLAGAHRIARCSACWSASSPSRSCCACSARACRVVNSLTSIATFQTYHPIYGFFHRPGASGWIETPEFTSYVSFNSRGPAGSRDRAREAGRRLPRAGARRLVRRRRAGPRRGHRLAAAGAAARSCRARPSRRRRQRRQRRLRHRPGAAVPGARRRRLPARRRRPGLLRRQRPARQRLPRRPRAQARHDATPVLRAGRQGRHRAAAGARAAAGSPGSPSGRCCAGPSPTT